MLEWAAASLKASLWQILKGAVEELDVLELGPDTRAMPMMEPMAMATASMAVWLALCPELLLLAHDLLDLESLFCRS